MWSCRPRAWSDDPWIAGQVPVVLDEVDDRGLVAQVVVDVVRLRPRRDDDQWQPRAEAAASLLARERRGLHLGAAQAPTVGPRRTTVFVRLSATEFDGMRIAAVDVVVPAVGVVVVDDHRGARPVGRLLERVDLSTTNFCSSAGSEYAAWPSSYAGRLEKAHRRQADWPAASGRDRAPRAGRSRSCRTCGSACRTAAPGHVRLRVGADRSGRQACPPLSVGTVGDAGSPSRRSTGTARGAGCSRPSSPTGRVPPKATPTAWTASQSTLVGRVRGTTLPVEAAP